jgi:glycosyltransferase involved in cell wall biosynthesis
MKGDKKAPEVSIQVIFKNEEKHLPDCINSILNQNYKTFELILIWDPSEDRSDEIVKSFKDSRIRYFMTKTSLTIAEARDFGLKKATGKYIFFTDADCIIDKCWIENGLKLLNTGIIGVEGKIVYLNKTPTVSDKIVENYGNRRGMTANIAYHASAIKKLGFNLKMKNMMEDRELYLRALKEGRIVYSDEMLVYHQIEKWNYKSLISGHKAMATSKVYLYKNFKDTSYTFCFIAFPRHLLTLLFPPLLIYKGFRDKVRSWYDLKILLSYYVAYLFERIIIWKTAIKEKVFIL